jgi:hypothetical protein
MSQAITTVIAEPVLNREGNGNDQSQLLEGFIRILERNPEKSLYLQDMKDIQHFTFKNSRENGILLYIYHNMLVGKDRPSENRECMSEIQWNCLEQNRDILIRVFFVLMREDEEEMNKKKWWYRLLQFIGIKKRTTILPESHFI